MAKINATLRIGIDFHGVVVDIQALKEKHSKKFLKRKVPRSQLKRRLLHMFDICEAAYEKLLTFILGLRIFLKAKPMKDALPVIRKLEADRDEEGNGHVLICVTASGPRAFKSGLRWCKKHSLFQKNFQFVSCERNGNKTEIAKRFRLNIFLDNDLEKLVDLDGTVQFRFLLTDDYNRDQVCPPGIIRVKDLNEFYRYVSILANFGGFN